MRFLGKLLAAIGLSMAVAAATASPAAPQIGVEYLTIGTPQPTDTGNKVEVIEFFGYFCSACYSFDPALREWTKKQGGNIVFKRVHIGSSPAILPQQKLFYTLSAMDRLEQLHSKIFEAMHVQRLPLRSDEQIFDFVEKNGVDRGQFIEIYNSFATDSLTRAATQLQALFQVNSVPMIVIDGRYLTSLAMVAKGADRNISGAQLQAATFQVMDALVARARQERGTVKSVVRK